MRLKAGNGETGGKMQKTLIEWVKNPDGTQGYTWNPITGCLHGCPYCYAKQIARRFGKTQEEKDFVPAFHPERLADLQKIKKPSTIFVCSMADLFGKWVPIEWIEDVLQACRKTKHRYIFLTKNPLRYKGMERTLNYDPWPLNCLRGQTTDYSVASQLVLTDFVSFEPLLRPIPLFALEYLIPQLKWVIVGAQTGPGAVKPKKEWVEEIVEACKSKDIPLFLKDNLLEIYSGLPRIQEIPWQLR